MAWARNLDDPRNSCSWARQPVPQAVKELAGPSGTPPAAAVWLGTVCCGVPGSQQGLCLWPGEHCGGGRWCRGVHGLGSRV